MTESEQAGDRLRLMCALAHPDDESLGLGGVLAKYADEGIRTAVLTATGGEQGWFGAPDDYPGPEALASQRSAELTSACDILGVERLVQLGHRDGELSDVPNGELIRQIVEVMRAERPDVVVTFDPFGSYGHPDHIVISQATQAAALAAADPTFEAEGDPHRISKLYYMVDTDELLNRYQSVFGDLVMEVDGEERRPVGWREWAITTYIDTQGYTSVVWDAVSCHRTQLPAFDSLVEMDADEREGLWALSTFYRVYSLVNGGVDRESDLFEGLR